MSVIRPIVIALAFAFALPASVHALNFVVTDATSDEDDDAPDDALCKTAAGTCSLRAAIEEANEQTGPHVITFAPAITAITLTADLPDIRAQVTIDGTNAGAVGGRVDINGAGVNGVGGFDCVDLIATGTDTVSPPIHNADGGQGSTISNLLIRNCADDGIDANGHGYTFVNNRIGTNPAGTAAAPNDGQGISIAGTIPPPSIPDIQGLLDNPPTNFAGIAAYALSLQAALTVIAEPNFVTGNHISGNLQTAITLNNPMTVNSFVAGNIIGLSADSLSAIPNGTGGGAPDAVVISNGAYGNFIGPGNVISGNSNDGIKVSGSVLLPNFIAGNVVGLGGLPGLELGNGENGIDISATLEDDGTAPDNPTGYTTFIGPANVISDNKSDNGGGALDQYSGDTSGGILVSGEGVRIFGNAIGLFAFPAGAAFGPADQLLDVGNSGNGIVLTTSGTQVGGSEVFEANFILHNERHGILVRGNNAVGNIIRGNFIGVAPPTGLDIFTLGNRGNGIVVSSASGTVIGGPGDLDDNVIAANGINGVALRAGSQNSGWANLIQRNQIYANGVTTPGVGIGIDLEHDIDASDVQPDPAGDDPNENYSNFGQNQPTICTANGAPLPACTAPSFNVGSGATSVTWSLVTRPNTQLRIEYFSQRPDGMSFLYDELLTTDAAGLPVSGTVSTCVAGVCTSSAAPSTPADTRGASIVMTATDLFPTDVPPVDGLVLTDPANNTSEFSAPAGIPQEIAFSTSSYTVAEADGTATLVLQRLGTPTGAVSVDVVVSAAPGTASGGGIDYALTSINPITWADGDSADKQFTIAITSDSLDENDETVNFELQNLSGAVAGSPASTVLTITDDDAAPTISVADTNIAEGDASVAMPFATTLSAISGLDVVVTYSTADGSAVAGSDYVAQLGQTVTIPAGTLGTNILIDIIGDLLNEDDETLLLNISASNTMVAGSDLQAVGSIADNDPLPQLSINDVGPLDEGDGPAPTPFVFTLSLNTPSGRAVSAQVASGDPGDTALAPTDYASINQVVTIPAGMLSMPVTVNVVGDTTFEPLSTESFSVKLAADAGMPLNASLVDALGVGIITNDDGLPGTLQFTPNPADQSVMEDVGTATFTVSRSGGSAGAISTTISLGGTATLASDYTTSPLTLNWADADATDRTVTVTVNDDVTSEPDETVLLTLGAPTGGATLGVPSAATLTIIANDAAAGSLQFTPNPADQSVMEDVGTATFTVSRTGGSAGAISTTIALGGDATLASDYTTSTLTLSWADADATDRTITITVNDDAAPEPDETVLLTLGAPTGGATLGVPSAATLTIAANDAAAGSLQLTPTPADQSVMEDVGTATFTVSRTGGSAGAISTTIALGGDATLASDYTTSTLTLSWADADATDRTITITVNDDAAPEPDETVLLTLGAPTGGATLGVPSAATLTIAANDAAAGSLQFTPNPADQSVMEDVGTSTFTVSRTGGSTGAISTTIALGGDATLASDYTTSTLTLNWADADATDRTVTITVNDDVAPEPDETVLLTLGAPTGGATLGVPSAATLTIAANDAVAGPGAAWPLPVTSPWSLTLLGLLILALAVNRSRRSTEEVAGRDR